MNLAAARNISGNGTVLSPSRCGGSLLPEEARETTGEEPKLPRNDIQKQGRILMLPVDCIEPSPYQARTAFDEPEIAALAVSILQNGLLQPCR